MKTEAEKTIARIRRNTMGRLALGVSILALGGIFAAGCGGDDSSDDSSPTTGDTPSATTDDTSSGDDNSAAIALFDSAGCAGCHVLSVADASGTVGPDLDTTTMSEAQIETQIKDGGPAMPAFKGQISDEEISSLTDLILSSN